MIIIHSVGVTLIVFELSSFAIFLWTSLTMATKTNAFSDRPYIPYVMTPGLFDLNH